MKYIITNIINAEDSDKPKGFISWLKNFIGNMLFFAIFIIVLGVIASIKKPEHVPAQIEEVYYSKNGNPVVRTSPCNAYYLSFFKAPRRCTEGISLQLDKFHNGYQLICRSGLKTSDMGHDYHGAWRDSLKYVSEADKGKDWIPFQGKYLTFYFDTGDSLKLFPDNKKIYYDNKYNRAIYAFYYVTPRCRYLLTHCNVVRMKMDAVFDQNEIRKELREELTERFELADNYVFRPEDVKQTK